MRFDLFLYGWIDICGNSIYMYAVQFIFVRFDLFFAVLILNERVSLYLCAFNMGERVLKILSVTERHRTRLLIVVCANLTLSWQQNVSVFLRLLFRLLLTQNRPARKRS